MSHVSPFIPYLGSSGSNIMNRGDAYGLGLTKWNEAQAFINAGEDYLFRGEAPEDSAGAHVRSARILRSGRESRIDIFFAEIL